MAELATIGTALTIASTVIGAGATVYSAYSSYQQGQALQALCALLGLLAPAERQAVLLAVEAVTAAGHLALHTRLQTARQTIKPLAVLAQQRLRAAQTGSDCGQALVLTVLLAGQAKPQRGPQHQIQIRPGDAIVGVPYRGEVFDVACELDARWMR